VAAKGISPLTPFGEGGITAILSFGKLRTGYQLSMTTCLTKTLEERGVKI